MHDPTFDDFRRHKSGAVAVPEANEIGLRDKCVDIEDLWCHTFTLANFALTALARTSMRRGDSPITKKAFIGVCAAMDALFERVSPSQRERYRTAWRTGVFSRCLENFKKTHPDAKDTITLWERLIRNPPSPSPSAPSAHKYTNEDEVNLYHVYVERRLGAPVEIEGKNISVDYGVICDRLLQIKCPSTIYTGRPKGDVSNPMLLAIDILTGNEVKDRAELISNFHSALTMPSSSLSKEPDDEDIEMAITDIVKKTGFAKSDMFPPGFLAQCTCLSAVLLQLNTLSDQKFPDKAKLLYRPIPPKYKEQVRAFLLGDKEKWLSERKKEPGLLWYPNVTINVGMPSASDYDDQEIMSQVESLVEIEAQQNAQELKLPDDFDRFFHDSNSIVEKDDLCVSDLLDVLPPEENKGKGKRAAESKSEGGPSSKKAKVQKEVEVIDLAADEDDQGMQPISKKAKVRKEAEVIDLAADEDDQGMQPMQEQKRGEATEMDQAADVVQQKEEAAPMEQEVRSGKEEKKSSEEDLLVGDDDIRHLLEEPKEQNSKLGYFMFRQADDAQNRLDSKGFWRWGLHAACVMVRLLREIATTNTKNDLMDPLVAWVCAKLFNDYSNGLAGSFPDPPSFSKWISNGYTKESTLWACLALNRHTLDKSSPLLDDCGDLDIQNAMLKVLGSQGVSDIKAIAEGTENEAIKALIGQDVETLLKLAQEEKTSDKQLRLVLLLMIAALDRPEDDKSKGALLQDTKALHQQIDLGDQPSSLLDLLNSQIAFALFLISAPEYSHATIFNDWIDPALKNWLVEDWIASIRTKADYTMPPDVAKKEACGWLFVVLGFMFMCPSGDLVHNAQSFAETSLRLVLRGADAPPMPSWWKEQKLDPNDVSSAAKQDVHLFARQFDVLWTGKKIPASKKKPIHTIFGSDFHHGLSINFFDCDEKGGDLRFYWQEGFKPEETEGKDVVTRGAVRSCYLYSLYRRFLLPKEAGNAPVTKGDFYLWLLSGVPVEMEDEGEAAALPSIEITQLPQGCLASWKWHAHIDHWKCATAMHLEGKFPLHTSGLDKLWLIRTSSNREECNVAFERFGNDDSSNVKLFTHKAIDTNEPLVLFDRVLQNGESLSDSEDDEEEVAAMVDEEKEEEEEEAPAAAPTFEEDDDGLPVNPLKQRSS